MSIVKILFITLSSLLMVNNKMRCIATFSRLVDKLHKLKWFFSKDSNCTKKQYDALIQSANSEWKDKFLQFKIIHDKINSFLAEFMHCNLKFKSCWETFKLILILSHHQASGQRDFSINKELLTETLEGVSIASQRIVYNHICDLLKTDVPFSNDLLKSCKLSHSRYTNAFELKKSDEINNEKSQKKKKGLKWTKQLM